MVPSASTFFHIKRGAFTTKRLQPLNFTKLNCFKYQILIPWTVGLSSVLLCCMKWVVLSWSEEIFTAENNNFYFFRSQSYLCLGCNITSLCASHWWLTLFWCECLNLGLGTSRTDDFNCLDVQHRYIYHCNAQKLLKLSFLILPTTSFWWLW